MVDRGLSLKICGLTDCDQACEIAAMGVDAITTDYPARLRAHLRER